jgi:hypothetical protein
MEERKDSPVPDAAPTATIAIPDTKLLASCSAASPFCTSGAPVSDSPLRSSPGPGGAGAFPPSWGCTTRSFCGGKSRGLAGGHTTSTASSTEMAGTSRPKYQETKYACERERGRRVDQPTNSSCTALQCIELRTTQNTAVRYCSSQFDRRMRCFPNATRPRICVGGTHD